MIPVIVYVLLVTHFVADFLCQSDWMALNKSKDWWALLSHVGMYAAVLIAGVSIWLVWTIGARAPMPHGTEMFWVVNTAAHFVQDAITSRITSRLWFVQIVPVPPISIGDECYGFAARADLRKRHWFFVTIGFDQLLHYVTLFVTAGWWLT